METTDSSANCPPPETTDGALLACYARRNGANSEAAFAEIGRRYARLVYNTCLRELRHPALAEDAAQEVFLLLARKAPELSQATSLAGWLFTSARFAASNARRQEARWQAHQQSAFEETQRQMQNARREPDRQDAGWDEIEPHLNAALSALRPADRDALLIRHFDGASLAETGARLGLTANTARMRVSRALERVRRDLRRAGIAIPAAMLAALLDQNRTQAAPPSLTVTIAQIARSTPDFLDTPARALPALSPKGTFMSLTATSAAKITSVIAAAALALLLGWGSLRATQPAPPASQSARSAALRRDVAHALIGKWVGDLEYRDYRSERLVTVGTMWTVTPARSAPDALNMAQSYGGGRTDRSVILIDAQNAQFIETEADGTRFEATIQDAARCLAAFAAGNGTFVIRGAGDDDRKPAEVRQTITLKGDKLTVLREVRSADSAAWAYRNRTLLRRTR